MAASPDKMKLVKEHGLKAIAFSVARLPKSSKVVFGSSDFKVYEADLAAAKFEPKELLAHGSYVTGVALAGTTLASVGYDCQLAWYDLAQSKPIEKVDAHGKWIRGVFPSPDGKTLITIADDMVAKLWDVATRKIRYELRGHAVQTPQNFGSMLYAAAFSPDGKSVATGDKTGKILIWDVASGRKLQELEAPVMYTWDVSARLHSIGGIRSLAFSPDGKLLAVGGMGKVGNIDHLEGKARVEVFTVADGKRVGEIQSDKFAGLVNHLEFAADGSWLLAAGGGAEGFLIFLDPTVKKSLRAEKASSFLHDLVFDESRESFVTAGHNKLALYEIKA